MRRTHDSHNKDNAGFSLIELLVVIAIIGVLSAIALPAYSDYVKRSKISEAIAGLSDMRVKMEQYFLDNRTYAGACTAGTIAPLPSGDNAKYFTFACTPAPDATTYTVTATGGTANDQSMSGFAYSIDQANNKTTVSLPDDWQGAGNNCWVIKKDGSC